MEAAQGHAIIWECVRCKSRYIQRRGDDVSSCPSCKSDDRVRLSDSFREIEPLSPSDYMDLWRFARVAESRFGELFEAGNASRMTACPTCDGHGFLHDPACKTHKLCQIERMAFDDGHEAGRLNRYTCEKCLGKIYTIDLHPGVTPLFTRCKSSMGCDGMMRSAEYAITDEERSTQAQVVKFAWWRPADVSLFTPEMASAVLDRGELVLTMVPRGVPKS